MKQFRLIRAFFSKGKLSSLFIILVAALTLYMTVTASAQIFDQYYNYRILKSCKLKRSYIMGVMLYDSIYQQGLDAIQKKTENVYEKISDSEIVEKVYTVRTIGDYMYEDLGFGITIYEPDFADAFPLMKKYGVDFSAYPDGIIVSHEVFSDIKPGDVFEMTSVKTGDSISFTCAGKLKYPYKHLVFNGAGTIMQADLFFQNNTGMIMLADDKRLEEIKGQGRVLLNMDILFTVREDTTEEQIGSFLTELRKDGYVESMETILENSRKATVESIKAYLLLPLFLVIASLTAYFSIIIINVFKKQREMAVSYLCGATKKDLYMTMLGYCLAVSVIPAVICAVWILMGPLWQYEWKELPMVSAFVVTSDQLWVVLGFFILTVIVSFAAVLISMGRKSPVEYLRGLE